MIPTDRLKTVLSERYRIEREIGAGGMATVYLARDLKHNRNVALKVLRPELGALLGPERFLTEINVTANLQHPHLLPLFDSGEAEGLLFYVMPYVEGESLRDRLNRERQLPVDEALKIAVAVASALDYAHSQGIIHRDLKPENILLHASQPVVTDFGIALAISKAGGTRVTQTGLSLGTPQYMSPEQVTGDRIIDARSDVYSLGAVLYELLTGEPPHMGTTVQAIIAKVLTDRPQHVRHIRETVPVHVDAAVMCALAKLPADRFATAGEFADALTGARAVAWPAGSSTLATYEMVPAGPSTVRRMRIKAAAPWMIAGVTIVIATLLSKRPDLPANSPMLAQLTFPDSVEPLTPGGITLALSRDGSQLAFVASGPTGAGIYLRAMNALDARLIRGTEGATNPLFSPDGRSLLFLKEGQLRKVTIGGGSPFTVAGSNVVDKVSWSDQNEIIYNDGPQLWRVSGNGGTPSVVTRVDSASGHLRYSSPDVLPGGKVALITLWKGRFNIQDAELGLVRLRDGRVTALGVRGFGPRYVRGGYVVFGEPGGNVSGAPFSLRRLRFTGAPVPVLEKVIVKAGGAVELAVSENGVLVYKSPGSDPLNRLVRVSRSGVASPLGVDSQISSFPRVQVGGRRVAIEIQPVRAQTRDIWIFDLVSKTLMRVTTDGSSLRPEWSPDGRRIAFVSSRTIKWKSWDGIGHAEVVIDSSAIGTVDVAFGPAHSYIATRRIPFSGDWDIWIAPSDSPRALRPFLDSPAEESSPKISRDGLAIAYVSDESRRREVYVRSLPGPGSRIQVSTSGGDEPIWAPNGRELFYRAPGHLVSAVIAQKPELHVARWDSLFPDPYARSNTRANYDVFPNGEDFVFVQDLAAVSNSVIAIANWTEDLRNRMNAAKRQRSP